MKTVYPRKSPHVNQSSLWEETKDDTAGWCFDWIYTFDECNVYHRAPLYVLSNLCPFIMLVIDAVLLLRFCGEVDSRVKSALWVYLIAPIAAIVIQSAF